MRKQFPQWLRQSWASGPEFGCTKRVINDLALHTVCQSARCPNRCECWKHHTAALMILGDICTRNCSYCSVPHGTPNPVDANDPWRVAEAVRRMRLRYAVVTSVTRDDLADGGAAQFVKTVAAIRQTSPDTAIELLAPDFGGGREALEQVLGAAPDVFGHNIETVARLYRKVRDAHADYERSLGVLRRAAGFSPKPIVKSAFMVGHGETREEVRKTLEDLFSAGCTAVCIGQYLRPTQYQRDVCEFVPPHIFEEYKHAAHGLGFTFVAAGPFMRSSYGAAQMLSNPVAHRRLSALGV